MKIIYTLLLLFFSSISLNATTYTSTQNGNWMSFTTWSPMGVPLPGDDVIINHNVSLDTSFAYTSGSITVNSGGSLIQNNPTRDIWLNGTNAAFTNHGTTTVRYFLLSSGAFTNTGFLTFNAAANYLVLNNDGGINCLDSLYNDGIIDNNGYINVPTFYIDSNGSMYNYGTIQGLSTIVDSLWNNGSFTNYAGAKLLADSATNNGFFTNNGNIQFLQFTNFTNGTFTNNDSLSFTDMTNMGDFTNNGIIIGANNMWNNEYFDNTANGEIIITNGFLNADTITNTASFNNDGNFDIGDSFYNFNTITGTSTGSFTVQDSSVNFGSMIGSFDFCDATPPSTSPFVDYDFGTIDVNITYCQVSIVENSQMDNIAVYPNPTSNWVFFNDTYQVEVYNGMGSLLLIASTDKINLTNYTSGVYLLKISKKNTQQMTCHKIIKE